MWLGRVSELHMVVSHFCHLFELHYFRNRNSQFSNFFYFCPNCHRTNSDTQPKMNRNKNFRKLTNLSSSSFTNSRQRRIWSFHVVDLQRMTKKCTKKHNGRAQPLSCSWNLLFSERLRSCFFSQSPLSQFENLNSLVKSLNRSVPTSHTHLI